MTRHQHAAETDAWDAPPTGHWVTSKRTQGVMVIVCVLYLCVSEDVHTVAVRCLRQVQYCKVRCRYARKTSNFLNFHVHVIPAKPVCDDQHELLLRKPTMASPSSWHRCGSLTLLLCVVWAVTTIPAVTSVTRKEGRCVLAPAFCNATLVV